MIINNVCVKYSLIAARLGLDTVENVFRTQKLNMGLSHVGKIENFCVTGASKRGWTTWTIASVDKRVKVRNSGLKNISSCSRVSIYCYQRCNLK